MAKRENLQTERDKKEFVSSFYQTERTEFEYTESAELKISSSRPWLHYPAFPQPENTHINMKHRT